MNRKVSLEELEVRVRDGDQSFLRWLKSADRRAELSEQKTRAGYRFLDGYQRKVLDGATSLNLVLHVGSGVGAHASNAVQIGSEFLRYVGMEHDTECVKTCRRRFGGLSPMFQFHPIDYLDPPKLPRKFDYVLFSDVLNSLPTYKDLMAHVWHRCSKALVAVFDVPFFLRDDDHLLEDPALGRLYATYSVAKFRSFCEAMAPRVDFATIYSDTGQEREHVALLRHSEDVPGFGGVHHHAAGGITFPHYVQGLK